MIDKNKIMQWPTTMRQFCLKLNNLYLFIHSTSNVLQEQEWLLGKILGILTIVEDTINMANSVLKKGGKCKLNIFKLNKTSRVILKKLSEQGGKCANIEEKNL